MDLSKVEVEQDQLVRGRRRVGTGPFDRSYESGFVERFQEIVCGSEFPHARGVPRFVVTGDHDGRDFNVQSRHRPEDVESGCSGHVEIQQEAVGSLHLSGRQEIIAGLKESDFIIMRSEKPGQRGAHLRLIIQNSDNCFAV